MRLGANHPKASSSSGGSKRQWLLCAVVFAQSVALFSWFAQSWKSEQRQMMGQQQDQTHRSVLDQPSCNLSAVAAKWHPSIPSIVHAKPRRPNKPSINFPFVFFHLRKAGGTSWRKMLWDAARSMHVPKWIACHDDLPCESYNLPVKKKFAILAAHLYYADVKNKVLFGGKPKFAKTYHADQPINCLVSIRPTVSRVISCWNYRFENRLDNFIPAHNMTTDQWESMLPNTYSMDREGCNNEMVRVFGDIADETRVNTLYTDADDNDLPRCTVASVELDLILQRLSQCVVTVNGRLEDNLAILRHYIPWLAPFLEKSGDKALNRGKVKDHTLQPGAEQVILKQNRMDELVYQYGLALFEEQLRVAKQNANNSSAVASTAT